VAVEVVNRVDGADLARRVIQSIQMRDYRLLVRHRDIEPANAQRAHRLHAATRVLNAEADEGVIHTECHQCDDVLQLAVYTLPVLPVALATMPPAELSARLFKLVF
jgi:hypothetical protein